MEDPAVPAVTLREGLPRLTQACVWSHDVHVRAHDRGCDVHVRGESWDLLPVGIP
jgi:hypothetical protein